MAASNSIGHWRWPRDIGRTRTYVVLWAISFVFAIAVSGYGAWLAVADRTLIWTPYGVTTDFHFRTMWNVFGVEARASGIARGDYVVAIDDVPIERTGIGHRAIGKALARRSGDAVVLTLRGGPDGATTRHRLHWRAENITSAGGALGVYIERGSPLIIPLAIGRSLLLIAAGILLFGRRRDPVAAILSLGILLQSGYGLGEWGLYEFGLFNTQLVAAFAGFGLLLLGLFAFPAGKFEPRWTAATALLVPVWGVTGFIFNDDYPSAVQFAFVALYALALVGIAIRYRRFSSDAERQQVRWFLLGVVVSICCAFVQVLLMTRAFATADASAQTRFATSYFFLVLAAASFLAGLVISLLKFRLYDADSAIGRSVTYGVLTLGLLGIFAGSEKVIELLSEEYFGESLGALAGGLGAAVAAVMIVPLHHRISHWAEHRFQKNLLRLRHELPLMVGDLRETARSERIADIVLDEIAGTVRATRAALLIDDRVVAAREIEPSALSAWRDAWVMPDHTGLTCDRTDPLFPVRVPLDASGHKRIGWLLLGPRPDGSVFGKDERETLAYIADPIARSLAISGERAEERSRIEVALVALANRLTSVERLVEADP